MHIISGRLALEKISRELAIRILAREERPGDAWHPEYPLADERGPLAGLVRAAPTDSGFTLYLIRELRGGLAIGGLGFLGPPDSEGVVEFGYGLIPAARGHGYATEAVRAALGFARDHGALRARAETTPDNLASQRVLTGAGLTLVARSEEASTYEREL